MKRLTTRKGPEEDPITTKVHSLHSYSVTLLLSYYVFPVLCRLCQLDVATTHVDIRSSALYLIDSPCVHCTVKLISSDSSVIPSSQRSVEREKLIGC